MSITINSSPSGNILFDTEESLIDATSSNGSEHYIRAHITDETGEELVQSWSKRNDTDVSINLENIYRNLFTHSYSEITTSGFYPASGLLKNANINLREFGIFDDVQSQSKFAGAYNIHKTIHRPRFSELQQTGTRFLEAIPDNLSINKGDIIRLPILTEGLTSSNSFSIKVTAGDYTLYSSSQVLNNNTAYYAIINTVNLIDNHRKGIVITIEGGGVTLSRKLTILPWSTYNKNTILFMNNYGYYQYAYFFGRKTYIDNHTRSNYTLVDNTTQDYEIDTNRQYSINTGYLPNDAIDILYLIARSTDVRVKIGGRFIKAGIVTNRTSGQEDRSYSLNQDLVFTFKNHQL